MALNIGGFTKQTSVDRIAEAMRRFFPINSLTFLEIRLILLPIILIMSFLLVRKFFAEKDMKTTVVFFFHFLIMVFYNFAMVVLINFLIEKSPESLYRFFFVPNAILMKIGENIGFVGSLLLGILIIDFVGYLIHVFSHKYLWDFHKLHHHPSQLSWLVAELNNPLSFTIQFFLQTFILIKMPLSIVSLNFGFGLRMLFNYYVHIDSGIRHKYGLQYIFFSPLAHRVHHDKNGVGKNYGFCFVFWDKFFGTYEDPTSETIHKELGIMEGDFPGDFFPQIIYPFKRMFRLGIFGNMRRNLCLFLPLFIFLLTFSIEFLFH